MSKVIFLNIAAHGHTNPTLPVVKELICRGEEVIYYSFDELKEKIGKTGATYRGYDLSMFKDENLADFSVLYRMFLEQSETMIEMLLSEIKAEDPDYIIHDSICPWGKYIARILDVPAICSITTFAFSKKNTSVKLLFETLFTGFMYIKAGMDIQKNIASRYHLERQSPFDVFSNIENLNIVYTTREFQPEGASFNDTYKFVGTSISERNEPDHIMIPETPEKPIVYISLGTVVNNNLSFFEKCIKAFENEDLFIILSIGDKINIAELKSIPSNFIVKNYLPQLEVLSKCDIFITHGGMNSVHEGLYYGVPLIVIPQQAEQEMVAKRVQQTEAGIYLRKISPNTLRSAVRTILNDNKYKTNSIRLGESLKSAGGYKKAADEIMAFKKQMNI